MSIAVSIVDDDVPAREFLAGWIQNAREFHCAGQHGSVEQALARLPAEKPAIVLMDINLPGLSGIEGVRRLRTQLPDTLFVMLTVYEDDDHIFAALKAGASGYLLKQTPRVKLLESLKEVYNGGSPMTSNIARRVVQEFQGDLSGRKSPAVEPSNSEKLSPRECEVLELLARGYLYKEIVDALQISQPTVKTYIRRIYEKLQVHSRSQAVFKFSHFSLNKSTHRPAQT